MNDNVEAEQGIWKLISPSGKEYRATSPLRCCKVEMDERISIDDHHTVKDSRYILAISPKDIKSIVPPNIMSRHDWAGYIRDMEDD